MHEPQIRYHRCYRFRKSPNGQPGRPRRQPVSAAKITETSTPGPSTGCNRHFTIDAPQPASRAP